MPKLTADTPLSTVLRNPLGREVMAHHLPHLVNSSILHTLFRYPVRLVIETEPTLVDDSATRDMILDQITAIDTDAHELARATEEYVVPSPNYATGDEPSAAVLPEHSSSVALWDRFELTLVGPAHGNPFVDVEIAAEFTSTDGAVTVLGFYDGAGIYRVRFMPSTTGTWTFSTLSNARSLHAITGSFEVTPARSASHGPVRVADTFHFAHADGTRYRPMGTTMYAWTHQGDELEEQTLTTLENGPFNKVRMCVFPKSYLFNENEPERYPFEGSLSTGWDFQRLSPEYFQHLERRIEQLGELEIEADLILFHAYDRWGFSTMDPVADDRYLKYVVARLASYANVWWSLANEYDLVFKKDTDDWERFAEIVQANDPSDHLLSIHNCRDFYDHSRAWVTHASVQRQDIYKTAEMTTEWRDRWQKPIVIDECAYEGNIDQGWGNITGEELTRRFWEGAMRGGYVGHGETYVHAQDILWWSKGGTLHGSSPDRIGFLHSILKEGPQNGLEPIPLDWDIPRAGVENEFYLYYFGFTQPSYRRFLLDPSVSYTIDIIDTWDMTITRLDGTYSGRFRIDLPAKQFIAVRLQAANFDGHQ